MNKQKKLDKINEIAERFINAENHGSGGNWWYPKRDRIAYKIKISSFSFSFDDIKDKLTDKQKDFYKNIDELINTYYWNTLEFTLEEFITDIKNSYKYVSECYQAGRSGGWLEIDYRNELKELWDNIEDFERYESYDIDYIYDEMVALDKKEREISERIKRELKALNNYIESEYFKDEFINTLMNDEDISDYYRQEAKRLIDKI